MTRFLVEISPRPWTGQCVCGSGRGQIRSGDDGTKNMLTMRMSIGAICLVRQLKKILACSKRQRKTARKEFE